MYPRTKDKQIIWEWSKLASSLVGYILAIWQAPVYLEKKMLRWDSVLEMNSYPWLNCRDGKLKYQGLTWPLTHLCSQGWPWTSDSLLTDLHHPTRLYVFTSLHGAGDWTKGFVRGRQAFYQWAIPALQSEFYKRMNWESSKATCFTFPATLGISTHRSPQLFVSHFL